MRSFKRTKVNESNFKVAIIGVEGVGKSTLAFQFVKGYFEEYIDPTIESLYRTTATIDNQSCVIDVLDTADYDKRGYFAPSIRVVQGILFVYSITSLHSFQELEALKIQIEKMKENEHLPIVLVGNKNDLEFSRQVSQEMGKNLAAKWGAVFFETSAKNNVNVNDAFIELIKLIKQEIFRTEIIQSTCKKQIIPDSCKTM